MPIPVQEARGVFTRQIVARWNELSELAPKGFLRSFFTKKTSDTKEISIEVMRGTEKIAVDVMRGSEGNRNSFSKSAEKIFVPPFFKEYFDMTELDKYDLVFGMSATDVSANTVASVIDAALEKTNILKYKIERRYELMAAQIFTSGICTLVSGDNIDFKRKAASMKVYTAGEYIKNASVDPRLYLEAGATFLRTTGRSGAAVFNVILGSRAFSDLTNNPFIKNEINKNIKLLELNMPQVNSEGAAYHGQISAGSYIFNLWTYPETYDDANGNAVDYINADYMIMLPTTGNQLVYSFAGVPMIVRDRRNAEFPEFITQEATDYALYNYLDARKMTHDFGVMSAGVPVPVAVDRIYSAKVTGTEVVGG